MWEYAGNWLNHLTAELCSTSTLDPLWCTYIHGQYKDRNNFWSLYASIHKVEEKLL